MKCSRIQAIISNLQDNEIMQDFLYILLQLAYDNSKVPLWIHLLVEATSQ